MRSVLIAVFDGVQSLDVTGPLEVFAGAGGRQAYQVRTASLGGGPVRTSSGLVITPDTDLAACGAGPLDLLLMPGGQAARDRPPELVACCAATRAARGGSLPADPAGPRPLQDQPEQAHPARPAAGSRAGPAQPHRPLIPRMKLDLAAAANATIPDVLPDAGAPFDVLFTGINPGLYSAATGWHFARPGNRFWPALYQSGFTPRLLKPSEQQELAGYGLGLTNVAPRATAQAAELTPAELKEGGARLLALAETRRPRFVAIAGVTAYRVAFARPKAAIGPQAETFGPARLWILPNPSGLNASWPLPRIVTAFRELREAVAE